MDRRMKTPLCRLSAALALCLLSLPSQALEKLSFLTSWKAQAEHGGYYQALAKGWYAQCGLELQIRQGGPGVDPKQLLVSGAVDIMMASFNDTVFQLVQAGFPAKAVMAGFQRNPQILMTHAGNGIEKYEDMKGRPILIATGSRTTFWPFLRSRYGFADTQIRSYSGQIGPWMADNNGIQQGLITNEPYRVQKETGKAPKVFLLASGGYQAYGSVAVFPQKTIDTKPQLVKCFVEASARGWQDFLKDPAPAVALIRKDNPDNPDDVIDNVIRTLKSEGIVESADTTGAGIGAMTDRRWKAHADMLTEAGLVPPGFDVKQVYTLQFFK
jgi:NitT/TauT family transport system substrate-binding protein